MIAKKVFDRGDIVRVCLHPTASREIKGEYRPCFVITPKAFNQLGMTLIAPITQGGNYSRVEGFTATLMGLGTETQGIVLISGVRMVDLISRKVVLIEKAPQELIDEVLAILSTIIDE